MSGFVVINKNSLEKLNFDKSSFVLDEPSIVHAQFSKSHVREFIQEDNNLVIKLKDGKIIQIENFFEISAEAIPSDLVFNDDACSFLWFEFTDGIAGFKPLAGLEELLPVVTSSQGMGILPWVGGGLLLAGLAAAGGGSGDKGNNNTSSPKDESNLPSIPTVATITENKSLVTEGESIVITVKLTNKTTDKTAYSYEVGGTATPIDDYGTPIFSHGVIQKSGQLIVPKGVDEFTITYVINVDDIKEPAITGDPNETLIVTVGGEKVEVQIKDQDSESIDPSLPNALLPIVKDIQVSPATVEEGETLVYTIILSKETTIETPYSYSIFGTATPVVDFDHPIFSELGIKFNGIDQIIVPAGVSRFTISYPTISDGMVETNETLTLKIADSTATGIITDPSKPSIHTFIASSPTVDEGGILVFTVTLSRETQQEYKYQYSTSGDNAVIATGYAKVGEDYGAAEFSHGVRLVNGQLVVPQGVHEFTIQYKTNVDHFDEGSERLDITLEDKTASAIILDILNPPTGGLVPTVESVSVVGVVEAIPIVTEGELITITVKLTGTTTDTTTYSYEVGGTATPTDDYGMPIFSDGVRLNNGQLIVPKGLNEFTITYYTNIDHEDEPLDPSQRYETIDLTVGGVGITVGIQDPIQEGNPPFVETAKVVSVELLNPTAIEGEDFTYVVRFDKPTTADNSPYSFILDTMGANFGLDFGQAIFEDERIKYNGQNQILISKDIQEFIIKIPTYKDTLVDSGEMITLEVGGVSAEIATILDPHKPSVSKIDIVNSFVVEGNELVFKVYLSDVTPQQSKYTYTVSGDSIVDEIGFAKVWEDYGAPIFSDEVTLVNGQLIIPAGVQSFEIRYITNLDSKVEGEEKLIITIDDTFQVGIIQDPTGISTPNTAPRIITDKIVLDEDEEVTDRIDAIDAEGHALTYVVKDNVSHGVLVLDSLTGKYTYKPNTDFNGGDQFTIIVKDSKGAETEAVISITVNSVNDAPIFDQNLLGTDIANPLSVLENSTTLLNGQVTATDVDLPDDELTYSTLASSQYGGTVKINAVTGEYTYKPAENFNGDDYFEVTVTDRVGDTDTVKIYIHVEALGNRIPKAVDDVNTTTEIAILNVTKENGLLLNDSDLDNDTLKVTAVNNDSKNLEQNIQGSHGGIFTIYQDGSYKFDPLEDFKYLGVNQSVTTSVNYTISDGKGGFSTAAVFIKVSGLNDAPTAKPSHAIGDEDTVIKGNVEAKDIDQDDQLSYIVTIPSLNGVVDLDEFTGQYTYTPKKDYHGEDRFVVRVSDGHGGTIDVMVSVTVNPVIDGFTDASEELSTNENTPLSGNVLTGTSSVDGKVEVKNFSVAGIEVKAGEAITIPNVGLISIGHDGAFNFIPIDNYNGTVPVISYTVTDGSTSIVSSLAISVIPFNDAPISVNVILPGEEDNDLAVSFNAEDVDGNITNYIIDSLPKNGTLYLVEGDKKTPLVVGSYIKPTDQVIFKPNLDWYGKTEFNYHAIDDGEAVSNSATVELNIESVNDAPIFDQNLLGTDIANPLSVLENSTTLLNGQVTATDVDLPNDVLSYSTTAISEKGGELKIDQITGLYTYKPKKDYAGPDQFVITVTDRDGSTDTVTIYINVTATGNNAPTALDDSATTQENTSLSKDALQGLLKNDSDPDGDTLTIVRVDSTSNKVGQVVKGSAGGEFIIYADGSYSFNPQKDFDYLQVGKSQATSITYTINDGKNGYATATLTVTVQGENDAPVIELIQVSTNEDTLVKGKVSAKDIDDDKLTYTVVEGTKSGEISIDLNTGAFVYKPQDNFYGSDSFTVKVEDGHGGIDTVIIPITIYPINDAPVSEVDTYQVLEGTTKPYDSVLINDTDIENTTLKIAQFSANVGGIAKVANGIDSITTLLGGTVIMNADGTFIYKAPAIQHTKEYVEDSFYYQATDGEASSAWTKVILNVQDSTPMAHDDFASVGIGDVVSGNILQGTVEGREVVSGVDELSADAPNRVESISINNTTYNIAETGTTTIYTENGSLTINSHGDYSYASKYQNIYIDRNGSNTAPTLERWKDQSQGGVKGIYGFAGGSSLFNNDQSLLLQNLSTTSASYVRYRDINGTNNDGLGVHVSGNTGSADNNKVDANEFIVFDLGAVYKNAVITLTDVSNLTEAGRITWYAFDTSGKRVATGTLNDSSVSITISNGIATVSLPKEFKYQYLALSSTHSNANFRINGLKAEIDTGSSSLKDEFSYILTDADGSQSTAQLVVETSKTPIAFNDSNIVHEGGLENGSLFGVQQTTILGNLFANDNISNGSQISTIKMKGGISGSSVATTDGATMTIKDDVGQLEVNIFTGEYSYTLFNATYSGIDDIKTFEYTFKDGFTGAESNIAELAINIIDDTPSASAINKELTTSPYPQTYNLVITLDVSGSMSMDAAGNYSGTNGFDANTIRLALAKAGIEQLIHSFDQLGNVNVKIISFTSSNSEDVSEWFIDNKTGAINFVNSQQADGGTAYSSAIQKVMDSWTDMPAADKTLVYFISDGSPDAGSAVSNTLQTTWQNFIKTKKVDDVFAIGMGTAGTYNLLPIASKPENAIVIKTPTELADTLLSTIDQGIVLGNVSILSQQGSTSGLLLGADGGQLISVIVDGKTYYAAQGIQQRILTQKGGQLDINFNTGAYQYTMVVNKTIKNQVEAIVVNAVDGDGDAVVLPLNITLNYSAYIDANRDTIITNISKGQSITISDKALLHNDKLTEVTKLGDVESAKNGSVSGTSKIIYTANAATAIIPNKTIQVIEESLYRSGTGWLNNDLSDSPKNNILGLAIDFTDRSQFGNLGNASTIKGSTSGATINGWAVDNGINGYTKVLNGSLVRSDIDFIKVYLYAGERIYIDVDGVSGTNNNPSNIITRGVFNADGSATGYSQTSDGWFNASTTGEYYIRLSSSSDGTTNYNLVLTIDNGTSSLGGGTSTAPKGWIGDASGSFDYVLTDNSIGENINTKATADIYYVSGTTLNGTRGDDILIGAETDDLLYGGLGNDVLLGGLGNDTLWGGEGNDLLIGGQGNDILYGGAGQDIFSWEGSAQGNDEIMDFKIGEDKIDIQGLLQDLGWDKAGEIDISEFVILKESATKTILEFHRFESTTIDTSISIDKITGHGTLQDWINSGHIIIG